MNLLTMVLMAALPLSLIIFFLRIRMPMENAMAIGKIISITESIIFFTLFESQDLPFYFIVF